MKTSAPHDLLESRLLSLIPDANRARFEPAVCAVIRQLKTYNPEVARDRVLVVLAKEERSVFFTISPNGNDAVDDVFGDVLEALAGLEKDDQALLGEELLQAMSAQTLGDFAATLKDLGRQGATPAVVAVIAAGSHTIVLGGPLAGAITAGAHRGHASKLSRAEASIDSEDS